MGAQPADGGRSAPEHEPRWRRAGPPYRLTREELVEALRERGYDITPRQLQAWVTYGILPKPERRVPPLAGERRARALYPAYVIPAVQELLAATLRRNLTTAQVRELAGAVLPLWRERLGDGPPPPFAVSGEGDGVTVRPAPATARASAHLGGVRVTLSRTIRHTLHDPPPASRALQRAAWAYITPLAGAEQPALADLALVARTADGEEVRIPIPPPPPPRRKARRPPARE